MGNCLDQVGLLVYIWGIILIVLSWEEPLTVGGTSPYIEYLMLYKHRENQLSTGKHEQIPALCSQS